MRLLPRGRPVVAKLGSDSSTSSNGGAPSMLLHTAPLPFFDGRDASQLSTFINGFRLDDRITNSIAACTGYSVICTQEAK